MSQSLLKSQATQSALTSAPSTAAAWRLYVFGDVHGRHDLLLRLIDAIEGDLDQSKVDNVAVIGLGDYIDRGPESRQVLQTLSDGIAGCTMVCLRGNHEQMLLDFLDNPKGRKPPWLAYGATETLRSYGLHISPVQRPRTRDLQVIRDQLATKISPVHVMFLQRMPLTFQSGDYLFVHAGILPGRPISEQHPRDLLWIRNGFADCDPPFEKVVVHGHTPVDRPYFGKHRINIDTGAYLSNRLTCLVLENSSRKILDF